MRRAHGVAAALAAFSVACLPWQYGPSRDNTRFYSVKQNAAGAVLYSVQEVVYRPAAGFNAYPDGGIPKYLTDRNLVGLLEPGASSPRAMLVLENRHWQHGQGQLTVHSFTGRTAVVVESGQRRDNYETETRYYLLDTHRGKLTTLALEKELASRGRRVGYFYLLDEAGALLFVTPPAGSVGRVETPDDEIWLRRPSGQYALVAKGADLYAHSASQLIYWELATRRLAAYDVATGEARTIAKYLPEPERFPESDVRISSDGKSLEAWKRDAGGTWRHEKIVLTLERAK